MFKAVICRDVSGAHYPIVSMVGFKTKSEAIVWANRWIIETTDIKSKDLVQVHYIEDKEDKEEI